MDKINVTNQLYTHIKYLQKSMDLINILSYINNYRHMMDCTHDELVLAVVSCYYDNVSIIEESVYTVPIPVGNGYYKTLVLSSTGYLVLGEHKYTSLAKLKRHNLQVPGGLTERRIKDSAVSWAWQFAEEMIDE